MAEQEALDNSAPKNREFIAWQKYHYVFFLIIVIAGTSTLFFKTVLYGQPLSRLDLIKHLDLIYDPALHGYALTVSEDPSACLQSFPKTWFVLTALKNFQIPYWNQLSGCGQPIMADLANCLFHPVNLLFGVSDQKQYNWGLLVKITLPAVLSFLWFLRRGAVAWAAAGSALGYALYARSLRVAELANTSAVPLIFLAFDLLQYSYNPKKTVIAALLIALAYYCMHPESFFIGILSGVFLWLAEYPKSKKDKLPSSVTCNTTHEAFSIFGILLLTGLLSIGFVAPTFLPFIEFLPKAYSYKYSDTFAEYISWTQFVGYLSNPKLGNNLFPGAIVLLGIPAGIKFLGKKQIPIAILFVLLFIFETRSFGLSKLFQTPPISYLLPEYSISILMLIICLWSSQGITRLSEIKWKSAQFVLLVACGILLTLTPTIDWLGNSSSQMTTKAALVSSIITLSSAICLPVLSTTGPRILFAAVVPLLNLATLWAPAHRELPGTSFVDFPPKERQELIHFMKDLGPARITACGDRLLLPNTSLIYSLSDLRTGTPLNSAEYIAFMKAAGAQLGYCNSLVVPYELNKLYDVAATRFILSDRPISSRSLSEGKKEAGNPVPLSKGTRIMPGFRLLTGRATYMEKSQSIELNLPFRVQRSIPDRYQIQVHLLDLRKSTVWSSHSIFIRSKNADKKTNNLDIALSIALPNTNGTHLLGLSVFDTWQNERVVPDGLNNTRQMILLGKFNSKYQAEISSLDKRFTLLYQTPDMLRLYRNNNAVDQAYIATNIITVPSDELQLRELNKPDFDPKTSVVLTANPTALPKVILPKQVRSASQARVVKKTPTQIQIRCDSPSDSILVVPDLYYPGWKASVDAESVELLRANYLFRAVRVPSGKHLVNIAYEPISLLMGLVLTALSMLVATALLLLRNRSAE